MFITIKNEHKGRDLMMKSFKKKVAAIILVFTSLALAVPYHEFDQVYAASHINDSKKMNAYDYTSSTELANKLTQIFNGSVGLYSNSSCKSQTKAPLGCSKLNGSNKFYIKNSTTGSTTFGWQCYIYANAVYNTLYNEWVGNASSLKHSNVVIRGGSTFSYRQFVDAGVRVGAYVRTTANKDCSYNRSKAHSFVILGYNEEYVTYIDGNSDGRGLVRANKLSWKELNKGQTTGIGRRICHVVQPTDKYFESLYGSKKASSGSAKADSKTSAAVANDVSANSESSKAETAAVDPEKIKVKYSRVLSYKKNSKVLSGNDVLYLQTELNYLGYKVNANSKYDSNTAKVIKQFQNDKNLTADGITGSKTWNAIENAVSEKKNANNKSASKKFTVKYNANGGENAPANQVMTANKSTALSKNVPTRKGYTFEGWAKSKKAAKADYKAGAKIKVSANITLYAVWKAEALKITQQPEDVKAASGSRVAFKVKATGCNLTYKWYYSKAGSSEWTYWPGHDYASTYATANDSWNEMKVYCEVTDGSGNSVKSDTVTVSVE